MNNHTVKIKFPKEPFRIGFLTVENYALNGIFGRHELLRGTGKAVEVDNCKVENRYRLVECARDD